MASAAVIGGIMTLDLQHHGTNSSAFVCLLFSCSAYSADDLVGLALALAGSNDYDEHIILTLARYFSGTIMIVMDHGLIVVTDDIGYPFSGGDNNHKHERQVQSHCAMLETDSLTSRRRRTDHQYRS
ncbi:hypothetical protein F4813DRAFT_391558 [Daldinia decipiens]|uniref:uncharacterized protein n=1 Tax=Daldinia decipiens TaxID=326647 RepID=UPI0020C331BE|nr:uncharacterized protein F4813DRAFT_391558 [Daldinia decipiens]KAI1655422.1 hypothetical protein F4813DRAFT_391558 [Daldinia decipiens]